MHEKLDELKRRLVEINDLNAAGALLYWDQSTYMPPGGAKARSRQLSTLRRIAHDKFIDPAVGRLLDDLAPHMESIPEDDDDRALWRVTRRQYERAIKLPPDFVAECQNHFSETFVAWTKARPADDFEAVRPYLEKTLDLSRRYTRFFPHHDEPIDALIEPSDYGMTAQTVENLFAELREQLLPLVRAISDAPALDDSCLHQHYPAAEQKAFGERIIEQFGYDFERGRQDETHHPYATKFSLGDVRITTRFQEDNLSEGLFSTLHEAGHALYEQGVRSDFEATPLARGTSAGVHESQSRLWENLVGRSRPFWARYYGDLQAAFPQQLGDVELEAFYRAINRVQPSLVRTAADEVTYNLHVMMRFSFERAMLNGELAIADLPDTWRERIHQDLGVRPTDDRDGVLQDVHWYFGYIGGAFQGYTLGNILSAQFFAAANAAHPEIEKEIRQGEFSTLYSWLADNIYQHGRKYTADEIVENATGDVIRTEPYVDYLRRKYYDLYEL